VNRGFGVRATAHSGWDINSEVGNNQPDGGREQWHGAVYSTGRQRSERPRAVPSSFSVPAATAPGILIPSFHTFHTDHGRIFFFYKLEEYLARCSGNLLKNFTIYKTREM
jgi:hypothetical protein